MNSDWTTQIPVALRVAASAPFILAAISKARDQGAFAETVRSYGLIPPRLCMRVAWLIIVAEALVGAMLLTGVSVTAGTALGVTLLGVFTIAISLTLRQGKSEPCGCFGRRGGRTGWTAIVRNVCFAILVLVAAAAQPAGLAADIASAHRLLPSALPFLLTICSAYLAFRLVLRAMDFSPRPEA